MHACITNPPLGLKSLLTGLLAWVLADLVDDAAGEKGGGLLPVGVEVERHQSIWAHREIIIHGQNLRRPNRRGEKSHQKVPLVQMSVKPMRFGYELPSLEMSQHS